MTFHFIKLILAMVMLFCAILVWKRTRDATWILMVFTALLWYIQILLDFLEVAAIIATLPLMVQIIVHVLPLVTFSLALLKFKYDHDLF